MSACGYYVSVKRCFARKVHLYDLISCFRKPQSKVLSVKQILSCPLKLASGRVISYCLSVQYFHSLLSIRVHFVRPVELISHVLHVFCSRWHVATY